MSIFRCFIVFSIIAALGSMVRPSPEIYFIWHGAVFMLMFVIFITICKDLWLTVAICGIEIVAIVLTVLASAYMWIENPTLAAIHHYYKDALYVLLGLQLLAFALIRTRYKDAIINRVLLMGSDYLAIPTEHHNDRSSDQIHSKGDKA